MKQAREAFRLGLSYLISKQNKDGSYLDFHSTGLPSSEWITAHVCWILENVPEFKVYRRSGARYLSLNMNHDGSWGFNSRISGDSSTTAQVLMVLKKNKLKIPEKSIQWLLKNQDINGGFVTYPLVTRSPFNNWSRSHDDTTIEVYRALKYLNIAPSHRALALKSLRNKKKRSDRKAFWWSDPGYIIWVQKKCGIDLESNIEKSKVLLSGQITSVPNVPFLLYKSIDPADPIIQTSVYDLIHQQKPDGSWDCDPCLRVTSYQMYSDERTVNGPIYEGNERVFSTAHAVAVLYEYLTLGSK